MLNDRFYFVKLFNIIFLIERFITHFGNIREAVLL